MNEGYTVLIVTIKKGVCKTVGRLECNEEFGSQEGRAGTPLLVITISPVAPSSVCLIPSATTGDPAVPSWHKDVMWSELSFSFIAQTDGHVEVWSE